MTPFTHKYAEAAWLDFEKDKSGGFSPVSLTVVANIPLARASTGYQASRVIDLENAAIGYAKKLGVPIIFRATS